jgi:hypothetical protein
VTGLRKPAGRIAAWLADRFAPWQLAVIATAFVLTGATLSRDVAFYVQEVLFAAWVQAAGLGAVVLAGIAMPDESAARAVQRMGWLRERGAGMDPLVLAAALGVTLLSAVLCVVSYQRHPHIGDEVSYVYQARYLAQGMLAMPRPPVLDAFNLDLFDYTTTSWYASAPAGWPFVLAIGVLAGVPWLVNPLLGGACVLLTWMLVSGTHDRRTGRIAALLLAASPWHALVGMSFMTHSASLAFALVAAVAVARARRAGGTGWALVGGLATGMVGMIRPLEGAIVGGLLGLWVIGIGGKRLALPGILAWGAGAMVFGVLIGWYNQALTGDPRAFPIMVWADRFMGPHTNDLGFGPDRGVGWALDPNPGHGPVDAIINANLNTTTINTELFGWATGSLLLVVALAVSRRRRRGDHLMLATLAAVFGAHVFYWFSGGPDFAARYWYLMIVPLVALAASGVRLLEEPAGTPVGHPGHATRVRLVLAALGAMALVNFTTWRAVDKYRHYLGMRPDMRDVARDRHFGRSLVLVRGKHYPDFASAATYNPIDLAGADAPVYAWDAGADVRSTLLPLYRDRPVWIVEGPALTGRGFTVVEGPLTADSVLRRDEAMATSGAWHPPYAERLPPSFAPAYTQPRR